MLNKLAKYLFGFSFLGARGSYRFSKKVIKGVYKNIHAILPFLSQTPAQKVADQQCELYGNLCTVLMELIEKFPKEKIREAQTFVEEIMTLYV